MSLILHDGRPLTTRTLPNELWNIIFEERKKWFESNYRIILRSRFTDDCNYSIYSYWTHTWTSSYSYIPKCKGHDKYYHVEHREYSRNYIWLGNHMIFVHMHKHIENKHPAME